MSSWRSLLLRIGEKCPEYGGNVDYKDHIDACSGVVRRELDHYKDDILSFLLQCAEHLPHKIPFYGTVLGLLNLENESFGKDVLESIQKNFQEALYVEDCNKIRILLRFLTVLTCSKVLQPSSLVVVYETLLSSAATTVDEEKGNPSWQARADFYIACILSCLPWGGAELVEQLPEEIERVMVGIEAYLRIRKHISDIGFSVFEDFIGIDKVTDQDFLQDLWVRIEELSSHGWKLDSVPRPHLAFEAQLVAGKSHDIGPISCPEVPDSPEVPSLIIFGKQKHEAELKYPRKIRRLNIFPADRIEDVQPIDRCVVEEYLLDVLFYLNGCRKECASYIVGLPVPFRYEHLIAETIFSQLLLLPNPPFKPLYYTLVIMDLCKALPGAFPAVVAGAVRVLFDKIAELDMECRTRLILWFSHHLSNFQFIWPWEEWAFVLELPKWAPQRVFVQEVLEREIRLSYWEKVKQSIENAPALEELLPPKGGPNFKYTAEDTENSTEHALSVALRGLVKERKTVREMIAWIEESLIPVHGFEITLRVIVQTLLDMGSKSFTHLITVLERYGQAIERICTDEDKQVMLINEVSSYWKNSSQMTAVAIDRMMGYRLISNLAIVRWIFSSVNVGLFHISDHPWEILLNAVNKTYNRILDLRKEIANLKKSVVSASMVATKAKADLEAAESKITLVDGKPVLGENPGRMKRLRASALKETEHEVSLSESLASKEVLLSQAFSENEALFLNLYRSFSTVLMGRLNGAFQGSTMRLSSQADEMAVDLEGSSAMELDTENNENGKPNKSHPNGEKHGSSYDLGENEQWCLSTLGYLKAITRQFASEIWNYVDKLDAEVLTEDIHPLFRKAVYSGLGRPIIEVNKI
ncbi:nuclear cap-binding protein subunit 1-like [Impatiens glandulifera]|uniref:nuclear cap-binding protein subunit 1-like n=1 Tax=Impatiens glandulifera TaxID=253017 RepID=UPI001FB057BF|nr:nuclear cap-binding protein subunit 1-like [Impatiens glandulifera]